MTDNFPFFKQHLKCFESAPVIQNTNTRTEIRNWKFRVQADIPPGETMCVIGDCEQLGSWKIDDALVLTQEKSNENIWSGIGTIPLTEVYYRFFSCILVEPDNLRHTSRKLIVRKWEADICPRKISASSETNMNENVESEIFGSYDGQMVLEKGWLTSETVVQFKLYNNPIHLWKKKLQNRKIHVKVTPVNLNRGGSVDLDNSQSESCQDEGLSIETMDLNDKTTNWPITEVAVLNEEERLFKTQGQFGHLYDENDYLIFQIQTLQPETTAYLMDFYVYGSKIAENDPPDHIGFSYILPSILKNSEGQAIVPITSVRQHPIGQISVYYLLVHPIKDYSCDMNVCFSKQWKASWSGLNVGHRGAGSSFKVETKHCAEVRENTIASLKAAAAGGADMVEFDVQLSKDLVPVIYHDFHVCISMKRKKSGCETEMLQLAVKELSYDQLQMLKVYHLKENEKEENRFACDDAEEHQPFPTLKQVLEVIDPHIGFNIELKWTMQLKDGTFELDNPFDINIYLDKILKVVLEHSGSRIVVFHCFNPDICTMLRLKQNKYAVVFLTQGVTEKYPMYADPRCQTVPTGAHFAINSGLLGINIHAEEILRNNDWVAFVKNAGLILFSWGDDNNDAVNVKHQKKLGVNAIICDLIDRECHKEEGESVFLMEGSESEKKLLLKAAAQLSDQFSIKADPILHKEEKKDNGLAENNSTGILSDSSA
nr:PREDICTED: glycerophosphocholine phosphodiesterase GPCPD1 [Bemisia tabaci]